MKRDCASSPLGTVRDWLDARADAGGVAFVFPETGETLNWGEVRTAARSRLLRFADVSYQWLMRQRDGVVGVWRVFGGGAEILDLEILGAGGYRRDHMVFCCADHHQPSAAQRQRAVGPVPCGTEGKITVRGANIMREYLKNPDATTATFRDGWLRTGDLGRMDGDGYVFVTGRLKELIIKGGENIAPREIDEALYAHPDVIEAAAFARPCKTYGETVEAAVALRATSTLTSDDLVAFCRERVGLFKSPDAVHMLAELPKGPSGKIQRLKLADLL